MPDKDLWMEYFKLLELSREPFSNSPDPAFFYESAQHKDCLQKLEIALRLRRGLNVVTGEVGTGKTTLCRQLIQVLSGDPGVSACLLLDPDFPDPRAFLAAVVQTVTGRASDDDKIPAMKEHLKQYLFREGVEEDRTIALIVDEGQKMPPDCLETLRELLNFETNAHKLFQVVIFAQNEFADILDGLPNLADRINLFYRLGPLNFKDTRALIRQRIHLAGGSDALGTRLFSLPALWRIFRLSGGFPRKIVHLCHQCLLAMIIQNRTSVTRRMVGACARRTFIAPRKLRLLPVGIVLVLLAVLGFGSWRYSGGLQDSPPPAGIIEKNEAAEQPSADRVQAAANAPLSVPETAAPPAPGAILMADANEIDARRLPPAAGEAEAGRHGTVDKRPAGEATEPDGGPMILGRVPVAPGDTLGGLVQKIYGAYTYRYHQAVLAANPGLEDPDSLMAGQDLVFPALSADTEAMPDTTWWVAISREADLGTAVMKLREETMKGLPLRLLAVQNLNEDRSFRIVLKTWYETEYLAELAKEQLGVSAPTAPEVFCLNKNETIGYGTLN
jgi:general secretion pathway protein A